MTAWADWGLASAAAISTIEDAAIPTVSFEEEPVPLSVFVTDSKYLSNPPLSDVQYDAVRHAERIYEPSAYEQLASRGEHAGYWAEPVRLVNFLDLEWGKGGGKDHICRIISLRISYLLLCLHSPQDYYSMPSQDTIHLLNVASSSRQASRAFFQPMRRAVMRPGNWFQRVGVEVQEVGRGPRRTAQSETVALQDTIRFAKNIEAISGHSDAETQEGLNLILGIADEIDAFKRKDELARHHGAAERDSTRSAEGIIDMLRSSGRTRFPRVFKNVRISYPRYKGSMIQVLVDGGRADNLAKGVAATGPASARYVSGPLATWEVNPRVQGKEDFADDYEEDPVFAAAKYECRPSRALNPFFVNEQAVEDCLEEADQEPLTLRYVVEHSTWKPDYTYSAALRPVRGAIYAMHADLAVTNDRAGVAMAHVVRHDEYTITGKDERGRDVELREMRPVVRVDFAIAYEADSRPQPPREIQIRWARELAFDLIRRGFNIRRFTFDQYQSTDGRQILETQHGIETDRVSTDLTSEPWRGLRDLFAEDRIRMARVRRSPEQAGEGQDSTRQFLRELFALSQLPNGKIDHPPGGSKDIADAVACAVTGAVLLGGQEDTSGKGINLAFPGGPLTDWSGHPEIDLPLGLAPFGTMVVGSDPLELLPAVPDGSERDDWLWDAAAITPDFGGESRW